MSIIVSISVVNAATFYTWGTPRSQSPLGRLHGPVVGLARRGIQHKGHQVSAAVRDQDGDQLEYYYHLGNMLRALNTGRIWSWRWWCTRSSNVHLVGFAVKDPLGDQKRREHAGSTGRRGNWRSQPGKDDNAGLFSAGLLIMHNG